MPWYFAALADACYKSACLPSEKGSAGAAAPCDLIKRGQTEGQSDGTRVPGAGALFGQDEAARGEITLETTRSASNQNYEACPRGK